MMHDKVWVLNPDSSDDQLVWLAGEIETKETLGGDSFRLTIKAVKGRRVETIAVASDAHGEVGSVQRRNEEGQVVEDLIRLTHLHEPAILHALVERFHGELIYTYTGPVLIAVNPFQPLDLYTDAILESYYEGGIVRSQGFEMAPMPPHVYAVAADAYQDMSLRLARSRSARPRGVIRGEDAVSQSILISGESGSGKTVSTKHCLEYLTTVGQAAGDRSKGLKLAAMQRDIDSNKIVQSNPILEAFGNARTLRNDNSSRFGKLVQIHFDGVGEILGGGISSYLLEKVRLVKQSPGERNFHIFYQLCATASTSNRLSTRQPSAHPGFVRGANSTKSTGGSVSLPHPSDSSEANRWGLKHAKAYFFSNQGGVFVIRDVSDAKGLEEVRHAMATLEFAKEEVTNTLKVAASVLHLGEISFAEDSGYGSVVEGDWSQSSARSFCELTGVVYAALVTALTTKDVSTKLERVIKPLRPVDAVEARDALAKALYSRLFDWLVAKINISLGVSDPRAIQASVNVLDIFGFECFDENSLEQLCINYTNEKLQQHFNNYVFKLEEEEYTREGIEWSFIDFPDNQDILDLIEGKKPLGILTLLDDECNNPSGSDKNFTNRIYKAFLGDEMDDFSASNKMRRLSSGGDRITSPSFGFLGDKSADGVNEKHPRFDATRLMKPRGKFSIVHYAGSVTYSAEGFWSKNRDEFPLAARNLLQKSTNVFVEQLFQDDDGEGDTGRTFRTLELGAEDSNPRMRRAASAPEQFEVFSSRTGKQPLKTVAKKFQAQLADLMARLSATQPHYIRCLKPNDGAEPFVFNQRRVAEQLRYGGVLEAVRVSRSGFPVRMPHGDFYYRYRRLVSGRTMVSSGNKGRAADLPLSINCESAPEVVKNITRMLTERLLESSTVSHEETYKAETVQFGKTKVFLRKEAHDALEARLVSSRLRAAMRLQATARRILSIIAYQLKMTAIRLLQRCLRGHRGRMIAKHSKLCFKSAVTVQSNFRGHRARSAVKVIRMNQAVLNIQKVCRGRPTRRLFIRLRSAMTLVQCAVRAKQAVATRKRLAAEAKSIQALQRKNDELVAKLAKRKDEDEEAKRGAERVKIENAKAKAFAEAETARQQRVDHTLKRVVVRFTHSIPLAAAMETWARATKLVAAVSAETKRQSLRLETELTSLEKLLLSAKNKEKALLLLGAWDNKRKVSALHQGWMRMRLFVAAEQTKMERERAAQASKEGSVRAGELAAQVESLRKENKLLEAQGATAESELKFAAWELRRKVKSLEEDAALAESTQDSERSAAKLKQEELMAELSSSESRVVGLKQDLELERSGRKSERSSHAEEIHEYQVITAQLKATEVELASEMKKCIQLESQALEAKCLLELEYARANDADQELRTKVVELEDALKKEETFRTADQAKTGEASALLKAALKDTEENLSREKTERASDYEALLEKVVEANRKASAHIEGLEESLATERAGRAEVEKFRTADKVLADEAFDSLKAVIKDTEDNLSREKAERAFDHEALLEKMEKSSLAMSARIQELEDLLAAERAGRAEVEKSQKADNVLADEAIDLLKAALKGSEENLSREKAERASDHVALLEKVEQASHEASERMQGLEKELASERADRAEFDQTHRQAEKIHYEELGTLRKFLTDEGGKAQDLIDTLQVELQAKNEELEVEKDDRRKELATVTAKAKSASDDAVGSFVVLEKFLEKVQQDKAVIEEQLEGQLEHSRQAAQRADETIQKLASNLDACEFKLASEKEDRAATEQHMTATMKHELEMAFDALSKEKTERSSEHAASLKKKQFAFEESATRIRELEASLNSETKARGDMSKVTEKLNAEVFTLNSVKLELEAKISELTSQLSSVELALSLESTNATAAGTESAAVIQELTSKVDLAEAAAASETEARASAERETDRMSEELGAMKPYLAATESELRVERMSRAADHSAHLLEAENNEIALQKLMLHVKTLEAKALSERAEQEVEASRVRCVSQEWEDKCTSLGEALDKEKLVRASERGDDQELIDYLRNEIEEVKRDLHKEQEDLKAVHQEATERAQYIRTVSEEAAKRIQELEDALELEETEKAGLAFKLHQKIKLEQELSFKVDALENALIEEKTLRAANNQSAEAAVESMREAVEDLEDRLAKDKEDRVLWEKDVKSSSAVAARRIQELEDSLEEGEYRRVEFELEGQHKDEDIAELREQLVKVEAELNATLAAAAAKAAAAEDPAVAAAKIKTLGDELAAEQAARLADQAAAAATEEQLAQSLRALRDEALLEGNQVPELTARVEGLTEALAKERAARGDDAKAHLAAHAAVEARSKHATDELRSQVGALMEAMAKERTVRAKQRGELDSKAATAASTVDTLKAKVLSLEQALDTERDKFKTISVHSAAADTVIPFAEFQAQAGASTIRERLEERLGTLKDESCNGSPLTPARAAHSEAAATAALEAQLARALSLSPPPSPGRKLSQTTALAAAARSPGGSPPKATGWLGPTAAALPLNEPPNARPSASPARQLVDRLRETPSGSMSTTSRPKEKPPTSPRGPTPTPRHMPQTPPGEPELGSPVIGLAGKGYQV